MSDDDFYDLEESDLCDQCGGDGVIPLSEAGPGVWGEDCFCDIDREITCPSCKGDGTIKPPTKTPILTHPHPEALVK